MIEKMTPQDLELTEATNHIRRLLSEETIAIRQLAVGEGIKMPCRWKHESRHNVHGSTGCAGRAAAHYAAKAVDCRVTTRCQDATLYVMRLA